MWHSRNEIPDYVRDMIVTTVDRIRPESFDLVFTALESDDALNRAKFCKIWPLSLVRSIFRYESDVPIIIPGINEDHIDLLKVQKRQRKWEGFICPLPNYAPLQD